MRSWSARARSARACRAPRRSSSSRSATGRRPSSARARHSRPATPRLEDVRPARPAGRRSCGSLSVRTPCDRTRDARGRPGPSRHDSAVGGTMSRARVAAALAAAITAATAAATLATTASAAPARTHAKHARAAGPPASDVREVPPDKRYSTARLGLDRSAAPAVRAQATADTPPVGTVRQWIALDDARGTLYRKDYTLRGVGAHIEVWVANDISFPAGDCRSPVPGTTEITDEQVQHLITEFDGNIYPKETSTFSTPPDRDGSNAQLGPDANGNGGVYTGGGEKTVTLVDNVRDDNYYAFPEHPTYIAGFFSSQFNDLVDRNVMTIDAFDWLHRTTANPPDEPPATPS